MNPISISPDEYRRLLHRLADVCADYEGRIPDLPSFPPTSGSKTEELFGGALPETGLGPAALDVLSEVFAHSRPSSPRFFGYVFGSGEPVASAADLAASTLNQNVTAWRSAPAGVTIERTVIRWLAEAIGCHGFAGSLTGGGSSANLMAMAIAREAKAPANEDGVKPGVFYASEQVHMSIPKAIALLGFGHQALRLIPADEHLRVRIGDLARAMDADREAGKRIIAVIASAGTVNTGAIDPLRETAALAKRHDAWFHVDGAYGALASIGAPEKFAGLELADSISLDPHKWLYQPVDCGCLLYRDPQPARAAFSHSGDYAKVLDEDPLEGFAFFEESMELSRRFRALKIWLSLRYHGMRAFRESIRKDLRLAQLLADRVAATSELELLARAELSVVCFRYVGGNGSVPEEKRNALNADILKRVVQRGRVYISNATLEGKFALRACIVNHRTTDADALAVVDEVLASAQDLQP